MQSDVQEIIELQKDKGVYLTNGCIDNLLNCERPGLLEDVFAALNIKGGDIEGEFFPLNDDASQFIGDDDVPGPYGGAEFGYIMLFQGKVYIAPHVAVCFDCDNRPFSIESYGDGDDAIYENRDRALIEAGGLLYCLRRKMTTLTGDLGARLYVVPDFEPDRHCVTMMFPPELLIQMFGNTPNSYDLYKNYIASLFEDYEPGKSNIVR